MYDALGRAERNLRKQLEIRRRILWRTRLTLLVGALVGIGAILVTESQLQPSSIAGYCVVIAVLIAGASGAQLVNHINEQVWREFEAAREIRGPARAQENVEIDAPHEP